MSFDKDNQSPSQVVNVHKRTTKVNFAVVIGVLVFFLLGGVAIWMTARNPPQTPSEATGQR